MDQESTTCNGGCVVEFQSQYKHPYILKASIEDENGKHIDDIYIDYPNEEVARYAFQGVCLHVNNFDFVFDDDELKDEFREDDDELLDEEEGIS